MIKRAGGAVAIKLDRFAGMALKLAAPALENADGLLAKLEYSITKTTHLRTVQCSVFQAQLGGPVLRMRRVEHPD